MAVSTLKDTGSSTTRKAFAGPYVTVVIPCRNYARFLSRAIESALAQPEVGEVIVIEDGGEDNAVDICRAFEASEGERFRWIGHAPGASVGPGLSRNEGIRAARYDWIAFLDADDRYLPGRFAEDTRVLAGDPSLDGVYDALGAESVERCEEPSRQFSSRLGIGVGQVTTIHHRYAPEDLLAHLNPIGMDGSFTTDTILVRRSAFEKTGELFGKRKMGEDTLLWLQLAAVCRLAPASVDRPVAMRGLHEINRARIRRNPREVAREVLSDLLDWASKTGREKELKPLVDRARLHFSVNWKEIFSIFRENPTLLVMGGVWGDLLRWALIRQYPDDPILPGFFPSLRRRKPVP